ncbi:tyrosine-type recombinase/integrase [Bacillus paralicheniformis]|uniref:tyrosine-type recombinase/integrase n=1 Tax=Bacillus paralicheniformis TaxID=1648923 RepID=UPI00189F61FA|nr:tyrosine-type recombinase/integrase [Bacillus paralicheniformis]
MLIESITKEFILDKKFEGLRETTLTSYSDFFKGFNKYLTEQGLEQLEDLNKRHLKGYLMYCHEELGNNPVTVNSKLKLLRVFCRWLYIEKMTDSLLTDGIKAMREDTQPKIVTTEDVRAVLSHLRRSKRREDSFTSRRNYILMLTMIGTGMRLSEITRLEWSDVDFSESLVQIRQSKSRKSQSVPLSESLARELLEWRLFLERKFDKLPQSVFITEKGTTLSYSAIQNLFKRLKKRLGLQSRFCPHGLRAYFIKELLKNGSNLRQSQLLARHSKIQTTQLYVGYFAHELKEGLDEHNPLNNLI